jgi:Tfp pilus assembly protein PilE
MALMLVLNLILMVAASAAAMLQFGSFAASGALAAVEHVRAFHAADAVMTLCERQVLAQRLRGHAIPDGPLFVFGRDARWPGSVRPPECAIERLADSRTRIDGYRITARGFGSTNDAQSWAQLELAFTPGMLHRTWRPLARRPVPDPWRGVSRTPQAGRSNRRVRRPVHKRAAAGLSLIEAMIALAVAAIIAGYAVPTYRQHLARAHRLSAALAVRQAAQYIEGRRLFDHAGGARHEAVPRGQVSRDDRWLSLPAHLARAPADGAVVYRIRVDTGRTSAAAANLGNTNDNDNGTARGRSTGTGMGAKVILIGDMTSGPTFHDPTTYWIVAVPDESGPMAGDVCGSFILDGAGRRSNTGTASAELCWSGA